MKQANEVLSGEASSYYVGTLSSTSMPLPDHSVDVVITDPPYGSYVHYADLCNFWSVWLPEIKGLGGLIDTKEEAVIARKRFPGAKNAADYQNILERTFIECGRVLKPGGYMVMTFHNREPRAWAALLLSITKAGFELPSDGIIFQDGIQSYKHTAQSRRAGSVIGDFILSFRKLPVDAKNTILEEEKFEDISEDKIVNIVEQILHNRGPMKPDELLSQFYLEIHPQMLSSIRAAVYNGNGAAQRLIEQFEDFQLFDSQRRQLLEQYFAYSDGKWSLKKEL
jgi:SAM-dependent methyltransferase